MEESIIDIAVLNKNQDPSILVEVKAGKSYTKASIEHYWQNLHGLADRLNADFLMLVTTESITIWKRSSDENHPILTLDTKDTLAPYGVFVDPSRASQLSLEIAAKQWLQDLILKWHSNNPPHINEMRNVGITDAISDGEVIIEARL